MRWQSSGLVLLVDDDEALRGVARRVLERCGFHVVEARTGEAALTLCEEHDGKLRLVLLDLTMPGLSGAVTLGEIRWRWPSLPVVVSSGLVPDDGDGLAGVPFLAKPYRPSDLADVVRRLIEGEMPELKLGPTC
jgi:two-component system cell cycle sensor histidine kinase/response regulator CckA